MGKESEKGWIYIYIYIYIYGERDVYMYMIDLLWCTPETNTTL